MDQLWQQLPKEFLKKLESIAPKDQLEEIHQALCQERPTTFRANTLKISSNKLIIELQKLGINFEQISWYKNAFILKDQPQSVLQDTYLYKEGYLYVQSLSSMIPALILNPQPKEKILDLTAAPGSKTTQMAMMMGNSGQIVANDTSRPRLYRLEANAKIQEVNNITVTQLPGQILWQKFPEYFDKSLVDAPCSMEGRFCATDNKTYRDWTPGKVKGLAPRQSFLLRSAISATKPGGMIVYSTCTLSPEENEGVIDWILKKETGNVSLENISIANLKTYPGLKEYKGKKYDTDIIKTVRIYPTRLMEGFFVAKLKKVKTNF